MARKRELPHDARARPGAADQAHRWPGHGRNKVGAAYHRCDRNAPGDRIGPHHCAYAEDVGDHLRVQRLARGRRGRDPSARDDAYAVRVTRSQTEVVEDAEDRHSVIGERAHQLEHLERVVEVEVARGLVEQQHARLLRQRLREREPLEVAARELVGGLIGQPGGVGACHDVVHDRVVGRARIRQPPQMRMAPHLHVRARREREGRGLRLRHHAHQPCAFALGHAHE